MDAPSTSRDSDGRLPKLPLSLVLQFVGFMAFLLYALLLWGYDVFYSGLGLRPEDVGIDKAAIVGRTLGLLPVVAVASALLLKAVPRVRRQDDGDSGSLPDQHVNDVVNSTDVRAGPSLTQSSPAEETLPRAGSSFPGDQVVRARAPSGRAAHLLREHWVKSRKLLGALVVAAVLVASMVSLAERWLNGKRTHLELGYRITAVRVLRLTVIDLRAEPASVEWLSPSAPRPVWMSTDLSYLGQSGAVDVLYAVHQGVVRVPAADVSVTLQCIRGPSGKSSPVIDQTGGHNRCNISH
jgi:hypothetical protein